MVGEASDWGIVWNKKARVRIRRNLDRGEEVKLNNVIVSIEL
jgi:hypothetical protein